MIADHLQITAQDLAAYAVGKGFDPYTLGGADSLMRDLADERPHFAEFLYELSPDELLTVLETADQLVKRTKDALK